MKKKLKVVVLIFGMFFLTACGNTNYILDKEGKQVTSKGQALQRSIYCRPTEGSDMDKLYKKYEKQMDIKLSKLPACEDFKITSNKTKSLWQFLFVKPLAYLVLKLGQVFKSWGLTKAYLAVSLMVIGLLIRIIILPFNIKMQNQSKKLQKLMPEMQKIEKKYSDRTDKESILLKTQETQALYKKYKVNPMLSCLLSLIQLPIFFAFLQAIYKIPTIYEGELFGLGLGTTPSVGIFENHNYLYLVLVLLIIVTTYFSFKYTMNQNNTSNSALDSKKQMNTMLIVMTIVISFASFGLPTAIALYWIVTYAFIIIQTFITNLLMNRKKSNKGNDKNIKNKLKIKENLRYGNQK